MFGQFALPNSPYPSPSLSTHPWQAGSLLQSTVSEQSDTPSQSLSRVSLQVSSPLGSVGAPGTQLSCTVPLTHWVAPIEAQTPIPQVVGVELNSSSILPSQSLSIPSQVASLVAGVPAVQLSWTLPLTQEVVPVAAHWPKPQVVGCETYPSSTWPLQSLSTPSQLRSFTAGVPAVQLSDSTPAVQEVVPVAWQAPTPQVVELVT